jgi:hypothetical protein
MLHMRIESSIPADAKTKRSTALQAILRISEACPVSPAKTARGSPVRTFHRRIDSSAEADKTRSGQ